MNAFTLLLVLLLPLPLPAAQTQSADKQTAGVCWQLSDARVVDRGQTVVQPDGTLTSGYTVEAKAASADPEAPFPLGTFRLILTVFSPKTDMPGQTAGRWYLHGSWTIVAFEAAPEALRVRHNPYTLKGGMGGELDFNPALGAGEVQAKVFLKHPPAQGRAGPAGEGRFLGDEKFEGVLHLPPLW